MKELPNKIKYLGLIALVALIFFFGLATGIMQGAEFRLDHYFFEKADNISGDLLYSLMSWITHAGSVWFLTVVTVVVTVLLLFSKLSNWYSVFLCINMLGISLWVKGFKRIFERERPEILAQFDGTGYSFPSGHSAGSLALYGMLSFIVWKYISNQRVKWLAVVSFLLLALVIACSRVVLQVHYVTDIMAGIALSTVWVFICIAVLEHFLARKKSIG
ncbi:phosphatase PAP2 family protein [Gracilibacillus phocaeensis]|uniref:phosphatase PAP2 family protein n=1 Tax=Gracilibacillus phocaeensis TaxID=2042304 RepID=UPI0010324AB6|nr:phosphatase PAP2 family protein [Gracilibacillus phocaeensis]